MPGAVSIHIFIIFISIDLQIRDIDILNNEKKN